MDGTTDMTGRFTEFFYSADNVNKRKVLVISKYAERNKVNVYLLKYFLLEMKMKGIFITIDQPHQYIAYLLKLHNVPQDSLVYIDAISRISGEKDCNVSNVRFLNGPYCMDFLDDISSISCASGTSCDQMINLGEMDFILVDDIAALTKYQEEDGVRKIISTYMDNLERLKNITAPIVLDANQNKFIYDMIAKKCDSIVLINLSKSVFKEILRESNAFEATPMKAVPLASGCSSEPGGC